MNFLVKVVLTNDDQFTTFVYPYRTATVHNTFMVMQACSMYLHCLHHIETHDIV